MSKYNSPFSVNKRIEVFLDHNDPRVRNANHDKTRARIGRDVTVVGPPEPQGRKNITSGKRRKYWFAGYLNLYNFGSNLLASSKKSVYTMSVSNYGGETYDERWTITKLNQKYDFIVFKTCISHKLYKINFIKF